MLSPVPSAERSPASRPPSRPGERSTAPGPPAAGRTPSRPRPPSARCRAREAASASVPPRARCLARQLGSGGRPVWPRAGACRPPAQWLGPTAHPPATEGSELAATDAPSSARRLNSSPSTVLGPRASTPAVQVASCAVDQKPIHRASQMRSESRGRGTSRAPPTD